MTEKDRHLAELADDVVRARITRSQLLRRGAALGLGGAALAPLLAACGGDDDDAAAPPAETTAGATTDAATTEAAAAEPTRGGTLRVALIGGEASGDTLIPAGEGAAELSQSFRRNVYSKLADMNPEGTYELHLAESMEPNATADEWQIKLKADVVFHDGSPLTSDDVIYTLQHILDPANELGAAAGSIDMVDPNGLTRVDDLTLTVKLTRPWSDFMSAVGQRWINIMKEGAKPPFTVENTIGTGPFKLTGWEPGSEYTYEANPDYFESGKPYIDGMTILGIPDPAARVNALVAGQVDCICDVPAVQIPLLEGADRAILVSPGGNWTPIYINTQAPPFDDPRVRQAMKHLIDRDGAIQAALGGYGTAGNDIFARWDPLYAADLEQRAYDPEQAKALLEQAGQLDTVFTLHTSETAADMVPTALVIQQGAEAAGIKLELSKDPPDSYWDDTYGKEPFAFSSWGYRPFFAQWQQSFAAWNEQETNWGNDVATRANALVDEAAATSDEARIAELTHEAQTMLWDDGGYIIPYFKQSVDGHAKNVMGFKPHVFPFLSWYTFWDVWLA